MTTEAVAPNYFLLPDGKLFSRFFKSLKKPEYAILAGKFVAGAAIGVLSGYTMKEGNHVPACLMDCLLPRVSGGLIDKIFETEVANCDQLTPKTMAGLSTVASYTGVIVGTTAILLVARPLGYETDIVLGLAGAIAGSALRSLSGGPPWLSL